MIRFRQKAVDHGKKTVVDDVVFAFRLAVAVGADHAVQF